MPELDDDDPDLDGPNLAQMDLHAYRALATQLPTPSAKQIEAFVGFVAHAHSWYKHMSLVAPTATLQFFLDPYAGMQRVGHPDGTVTVEWRQKRGFHYSWLPTQRYRQSFGYLAFSTAQGTSVSMRSPSGDWLIPSDDSPVVLKEPYARLELVPPEVLKAGAAEVSGLIHTLGASTDLWAHWLIGDDDLPPWPNESGGRATMEGMRSRCAELRRDRSLREKAPTHGHHTHHDMHVSQVDYRFYQLVQPERDRQLAGISAAIQRVISLLAEEQRPPITH